MGSKVFAQANFPARLIFLHSVVGAEVLNPGLKQGETQDRAGVHEWAKGRLAALQKELGGKLNQDSRVWGAEHQQGLAQEIASAEGEIRLVQAGDTLGAIAKGLGRLDYGSPVEYRGNSARLDRQRGLNPTGKLREADLVYPGQYVWREAGKVIVSEEAPNWVRGQAEQPPQANSRPRPPAERRAEAAPRLEHRELISQVLDFTRRLPQFQEISTENVAAAQGLLKELQAFLVQQANAELQQQATALEERIAAFEAKEQAEQDPAEVARYSKVLELYRGKVPEPLDPMLGQLKELLQDPPRGLDHRTEALRQALGSQLGLTIKPAEVADLTRAELLANFEQSQLAKLTRSLVPLVEQVSGDLKTAMTESNPEKQKVKYNAIRQKIEEFLRETQSLDQDLTQAFQAIRVDLQDNQSRMHSFGAYKFLLDTYMYTVAQLKQLGSFGNFQQRFNAQGESTRLTEGPIISQQSEFLVATLREFGFEYNHQVPFAKPPEVVFQHSENGSYLTLVLDQRGVVTGMKNFASLQALGVLPKSIKTYAQFSRYLKDKEKSKLKNAEIAATKERNTQQLWSFLTETGKQDLDLEKMLRGIAGFGRLFKFEFPDGQAASRPLASLLIDYGKMKNRGSNEITFRNLEPQLTIEGPSNLMGYPLTSLRFFRPQQQPDRQFAIETQPTPKIPSEFILTEEALNSRALKIANRFWDERAWGVFWQQRDAAGVRLAAKVNLVKGGQQEEAASVVEIRKEASGSLRVYDGAGEVIPGKTLHKNDQHFAEEWFFRKLR